MRVLGLETSCDDTGVAVYDSESGLLSHLRYSQAAMHNEYGGVVPELASRDHIRKALPLVRHLLDQASIPAASIEGVAYTSGPGLAGALLVGAAVGRSLAQSWGVPAIGVHHMEGHLLSPMLEDHPPAFPFLALLVSGGHTLLADVRGVGQYNILGQSLDDAAGEAFDKSAKLLGLGYPGGPAIEKAARDGEAGKLRFPRPMTDRPGLDFSFSGLKTACSLAIADSDLNPKDIANIAAELQAAVIDTLVTKVERAAKQSGLRSVVVAGGVSANQWLRERMDHVAKSTGIRCYFPRLEFCTDNGAMIAYAGCQRLRAGQSEGPEFSVRPRWSLADLPPIEP